MRSTLAIFLALIFCSSCDEPAKQVQNPAETPPVSVGDSVTVQFRRDALGGGANLPVSPMSYGINGADVCIIGKVEKVQPGWLSVRVVKNNETVNGKPVESVVCVPLQSILLIEKH
jgi:hypothetical protein